MSCHQYELRPRCDKELEEFLRSREPWAKFDQRVLDAVVTNPESPWYKLTTKGCKPVTIGDEGRG